MLGGTAVDGTADAVLLGQVPTNPAFSGLRFGLQTVGTRRTLAPGVRLSDFAALTLY